MRRSEHQKRALDAEAAHHGAHGIIVGYCRQHDAGTAHGGERCRRILGRTVDITVCTQRRGERGLVGTARDRDGLETHLRCELHAEMPEAAETMDRH